MMSCPLTNMNNKQQFLLRNGGLDSPIMRLSYLSEPELSFANGSTHINPKIGIPLYGPKSVGTPRHKNEIHIGFVGEAESIENVLKFIDDCSVGVNAKDIENGSLSFPGLSSEVGYRFEIVSSDQTIEKITSSEREKILKNSASEVQFSEMLNLIDQKASILCEKDHPIDYIFVVLTEDIYQKLRVADTIDPILGTGVVKRNFRRAIKARLMRYQKPTQIIRESTTGYTTDHRDVQDLATRAWNLFTGMYFKVGGLPWGPIGLEPATCFVGISFFRPLGEPSFMRASIAQAFNEHGDGLVLRGQKFRWGDDLDKSPHLPANLAEQLVREVLEMYKIETKQSPRRVVIHKSSRYTPDERNGFTEALKEISEVDLVTVGTSGNFRLFREGEYPPLRGTLMEIGDNHFLYSTGYIPELKKYPHGHVPVPLRIIDHYGDTAKAQLLNEILSLTKMNWNTANVDGSFPITLQFARLVGEILREIPEDRTPNPKYSFYM